MLSVEFSELLNTLEQRFRANMQRHPMVDWAQVAAKLSDNPAKLAVLLQMEQTGGEPDLVVFEPAQAALLYCDCAKESPPGRRSLCFDRAALDARKANKPDGNVAETAATLGIQLLTEGQYRSLQQLGEFDLKTSSWLATPADIRTLGGAIFGDRRYGQVFVYHNGAESYYAARGFRGLLQL